MARVLIVDDEPAIRDTSRQFLVRQGHDVREAGSVADAVDALDAGSADVVVTDIVMSGGDGLSLLKAIRERHPDTKVILITGEPSIQSAAEAVRAGAFDYLSKPLTRADMVATVQRAVDSKAIEDENRRYRDGLADLVAARTTRLTELLDQVVLALTRAMVSHRPYRPARPVPEALGELRALRGTSYDGDCVDACVAAVEAGEWRP
jgi:DNA-binding NtrC family response regulator